MSVEPPVVARPEDVLAGLRAPNPEVRESARIPIPVTFIGDGAGTYRDLILQTLGDRARIADPASPLLAGVVAQLAGGAHGRCIRRTRFVLCTSAGPTRSWRAQQRAR